MIEADITTAILHRSSPGSGLTVTAARSRRIDHVPSDELVLVQLNPFI